MQAGSCPLDQPFTKPAAPAQAAFEPGHVAVIALVIIAEQMQQAMQCQHAQLGRRAYARPRVPGARQLPLNHDIAEIATARPSGNERTSVILSFFRYLRLSARTRASGDQRDGHRARALAAGERRRARTRAAARAWPTTSISSRPCSRGRRFTPFLREGVVGLHDLLHQLVTDDIFLVEVHDRRSPRCHEPPLSPRPDRTSSSRQIDLRDVSGNDRLRSEAEPREEHLHLLAVVFCASSRMTNASFSVRPRMKAIGATSIVPRSISRVAFSVSIMS